MVVGGEGVVFEEGGVDGGEGVLEVFYVGVVVVVAWVVVGGQAQEDGAMGGPGEDLSGPVDEDGLVEFGYADAGVVHHDDDLVGAVGDVAEEGFVPVDLGDGLPAGRRWIGGDGDEFARGQLAAEVVEEFEVGGCAGGERFDVEVEAGEAGMVVEESGAGGDETGAPGSRIEEAVAVEDAADPGQDLEVGEVVEEEFGLVGVVGREFACGVAGAEVGKDVFDVMVGELVGEFAEAGGIAEEGLVALVAAEPVVVAEPAVLEPEAVGVEVVSAVADVLAWGPEEIGEGGKGGENGEGDEGSPGGAFEGLPGGSFVHGGFG